MTQRIAYITGIILCLYGMALGQTARPEVELRLTTIKAEYLFGEPALLRVDIDTSGLPGQIVEWLRNRTLERLHLRRADGYEFQPLLTVETSSAMRESSGGGFEDVIVLQPVECWARFSEKERLPDWSAEFMQPGEYNAHVTQIHGEVPGDRWTVQSNAVTFKVATPTGRNLEAWKVVKDDPMLLRSRVGENRFPRHFESRPTSYTAVDHGPEALQRNIEFAREYLDTPYGKFAAVNCAMAAEKYGPFETFVDLYPLLGRLLEEYPDPDFLMYNARALYLKLDIFLNSGLDKEEQLATLVEFNDSLVGAPLSLRTTVEQAIEGTRSSMDVPYDNTNWAGIEAHVARLTAAGVLPVDPEVRQRRRAIALGRED